MPRKTVRVVDLINSVNDMLEKSTTGVEARLALCSMLENILHENGVYAGYGYLDKNRVPAGHLPGIFVDETGHRMFIRSICDETRRYYYVDNRIAN